MSKHRVLITCEVELTDPEWTVQELRENAVGYVQSAISAAERKNLAAYGPGPYKFDVTDLTLYAPETDYLLDLADLALNDTDVVAGLQAIAEELR